MKMILTHEGLSLQLVSICDSLLAWCASRWVLSEVTGIKPLLLTLDHCSFFCKPAQGWFLWWNCAYCTNFCTFSSLKKHWWYWRFIWGCGLWGRSSSCNSFHAGEFTVGVSLEHFTCVSLLLSNSWTCLFYHISYPDCYLCLFLVLWKPFCAQTLMIWQSPSGCRRWVYWTCLVAHGFRLKWLLDYCFSCWIFRVTKSCVSFCIFRLSVILAFGRWLSLSGILFGFIPRSLYYFPHLIDVSALLTFLEFLWSNLSSYGFCNSMENFSVLMKIYLSNTGLCI